MKKTASFLAFVFFVALGIQQAADGFVDTRGFVDASSAEPGFVGEWLEAMQTTTTTYSGSGWQQVISLDLTPGDWICQSSTYFEAGTLLSLLSNFQFALTSVAAGSYAPSLTDEVRDIFRFATTIAIGESSRDITPTRHFTTASSMTIRLVTKIAAVAIGGSKYAGGIRCWRGR